MTDALRSDRPDAPDRERDARIEQLLLSGLDHYFAGQHELAISVWTRVLFLDRGHARARAYIERARGALAERQREADELLHAGAEALDRGDHTAARRFLTSAVDRGASGDEALALLHRLDRVDVPSVQGSDPVLSRGIAPRSHEPDDPTAGKAPSRIAWVSFGLVAGMLIAVLGGTYFWIVADPLGLDATAGTPAVAPDPLPVPSVCEIRLLRAEQLLAEGRLREAESELSAGDPDGRHRARMDALRATIQRQLLAAGRAPSASPAGRTVSRPPRPEPSDR